MIKKIICLVFAILFILITPISSYFEIDNNVYASTFEQDISSELFKQTLIPILISAGLVFNTKESAEKVAGDTIDWLRQQGFDFKSPNDPEGPNLGEVIKIMLKGGVIWSATDQLLKNIVEIPQMFWELVKSFVDDNYDEGDNNFSIESGYTNFDLSYYHTENLSVGTGKSLIVKIKHTSQSGYEDSIYNLTGSNNYNSFIELKLSSGKPNFKATAGNIMILRNDSQLLLINSIIYKIINTGSVIDNELNIYGTTGIVDNSTYDWSNVHTQEREIVIPIMPDETGLAPKKDENEILVPGIDTEHWIGVTPTEIPNMDPSGEPYQVPGTLPENPPLPENPTLPEQQGNVIIEYLKSLFNKATGIKENLDISNPTQMGLPSADGNGTTPPGEPPAAFEWGDFKHFFDIFFIFIYFIVILILILMKFLSVVFSNLPNIPPNTELFNDYPTILEGVNFIKNLQVGGLTITVQQAFEYVFLIFFFIFVMKQIRKLYGAYVSEEHQHSRAESGISNSNLERRYARPNYTLMNDKAKNANYSGLTKGNLFDDALNNPDDYENINVREYGD